MPILDSYLEHKKFRKLLVCKLPQNHVTTKKNVPVSDYFTLVVFPFNCNLGLKGNSKIINYINRFYII